MMTNESETKDLPDGVVIRLLSSVLKGCEFTLTAGTTLFIVADEDTAKNNTLEEVEKDNTIFIPMETGGVNFEVIVADDLTSRPQVTLRKVNDQETENALMLSNNIVEVGALALAMRYSDEGWCDDILLYSPSVEKVIFHKITQNKSHLWIFAMVATFVLLSIFSYGYINAHNRQMAEISSLLGEQREKYNYILGKDDVTYIFAKNKNDKDWAQQALMRSPLAGSFQVIDIPMEEAKMRSWLQENWPGVKFHRVKLDRPQEPKLLLSEQRGGQVKQQQVLSAALKKRLTYADNIEFERISDYLVVTEAEQGLKKVAVNYSKSIHQDSVTFVIKGDLEDNELERVKSFVQHFEEIWGDQYIQFSIELRKDWLNGKSFKYGEQGYIKVSPYHWYFPKPLSIKE
ncbi:PrgH/EprH family type III secretion apparatus protein [Serratia liquefaciens]|uniref:PrgH/EprH family type III secretion apparatus protein n=1 Tax=Serratia liquefaciens TaxID=614 RepID=UPI0021589EC3|nr:PrgH/EprH family type III secretion apparatus protein [Serratia liquefaciens]